MFTHLQTVQLHDTDSFGILFFANQLKFCHNALEAFLEAVGLPMPPSRPRTGAFLVIVHVESDYLAPTHLGDRLTIAVEIAALGTTSMTVRYRLHNQAGVSVGRVTSVHVAINAETNAKTPLPEAMRTAFTPYLAAR